LVFNKFLRNFDFVDFGLRWKMQVRVGGLQHLTWLIAKNGLLFEDLNFMFKQLFIYFLKWLDLFTKATLYFPKTLKQSYWHIHFYNFIHVYLFAHKGLQLHIFSLWFISVRFRCKVNITLKLLPYFVLMFDHIFSIKWSA